YSCHSEAFCSELCTFFSSSLNRKFPSNRQIMGTFLANRPIAPRSSSYSRPSKRVPTTIRSWPVRRHNRICQQVSRKLLTDTLSAAADSATRKARSWPKAREWIAGRNGWEDVTEAAEPRDGAAGTVCLCQYCLPSRVVSSSSALSRSRCHCENWT